MAKTWTWVLLCSACLLIGQGARAAEKVRRSEHLLPKTTVGYVAVADVQGLIDRWNETQLGQLMSDPVMEPFAKDLRRQFEERFAGTRERLGLTLEDLKDVAGGEVAAGSILSAPDDTAVAIVVDVTDHVPQATDLLKKIAELLTKQGAKQSTLKVPESPEGIVRFDLPKPKDDPQAKPRAAYYCLTGNLLAASNSLQVARGILARRHADRGDSLADVPAFQAVIERCGRDAGAIRPQIRWFVDPLGYGAVIRATTPEKHRRKGRPLVEVLRSQGFGAVQGVGGHVDLASQGYEIIHRTAVHAPPPHTKAMKMLVFPSGGDFTPQPWVPRDVATYSTGYCDLLNAFENLDSLFDDVVGQGEEGIWQEVLEQLKIDPNGPDIDLRADLVVRLNKRITIITDHQLPITPTSERLLFAVETNKEQAVAEAVGKWMRNEPGVEQRKIASRPGRCMCHARRPLHSLQAI